MIVDDVSINTQLLEEILKDKYNLIIARDGKEAVKLSMEQLPDLILMDVMMPEIDGFQACREIKKNDKTWEIPIIFITAKDKEDDTVQGFEAGGVDYIAKPFNHRELKARISTHLELKNTKDKLKDKVKELQTALSEIKTLKGLLPICSHCKKIRDDNGYWEQIEEFIIDHSNADFSHSICPECAKNLYKIDV